MNNPTPQKPDTSQNNQTDGVLSSLVGPGKKYANEEALAKSRVDADAYIQKLESETSELRSVTQTLMQEMDMLKARASILDRINPPGNNGTDPSRAPAQSTPQQSQAPSGISQDDVEKLIEQAEQKKIARKNISEVDAALVKALGSEAQAYVKQKASDLGMEVEELSPAAPPFSPATTMIRFSIAGWLASAAAIASWSNRLYSRKLLLLVARINAALSLIGTRGSTGAVIKPPSAKPFRPTTSA